ncbi:MAG: histidine kinase [Saprospiraceae bacterium]|nr:histidine kinase [Saprospiraceae bacterium]
MKDFVAKVKGFFLNSSVWLYAGFILFCAYYQMQVSRELGWGSMVGNFFLLTLIFISVLIFISLEDAKKQKWTPRFFWIFWIFSFIILPCILILTIQSINVLITGFDAFLPKNIIQYFLINAGLVIVYWLLKWTGNDTSFILITNRLKNLSFFKLTIILVSMGSLMLPLISNKFQEMSSTDPMGTTMIKYISFVPQIFLIYFSYYLFYYINHHFLFKHVFQQKGIIAYLLGCIGLVLFLTPLLNSFFLLLPVMRDLSIHPLGTGINLFNDIAYFFPILVMLLSFPIIILIEWNKKTRAIQELKNEKTQAELNLLKQQINPHFFFNTLNNLYALSLDKSDLAPEAILKLSKLMRYVIYKGSQNGVTLSEEVAYLKDYLDLQNLRIHTLVTINFQTQIENEDQLIAPLLLINLVENAFKHGIEPSDSGGFITIILKEENSKLSFVCENSFDFEGQSYDINGIGLTNLKRRLELRYPDRHVLQLNINETFKAVLDICL